jgi:hypothetical protein
MAVDEVAMRHSATNRVDVQMPGVRGQAGGGRWKSGSSLTDICN